MRLRNRVRQAREQRGLSQNKLHHLTGISRPTLHLLERDNGHETTGSIMTTLCAALEDPGLFWWESTTEESSESAPALAEVS